MKRDVDTHNSSESSRDIRPMKRLFRLTRQFFLRSLAALWGSDLSVSNGPVVIIAPHPDDEVLGCGGLMAQLVQRGIKVHIIFLTGGGGSHADCCGVGREDVTQARRQLSTRVLGALGLTGERITFLDWEDGGLPLSGDVGFDHQADQLAALLNPMEPRRVFCPHPFEGWPDHVAAQEITEQAIRRGKIKTSLYYYCVWFWVAMPLLTGLRCEWRNAVGLDIGDVQGWKQKAMAEYLSPCGPCGTPWSGWLPEELVRAAQWNRELYFKAEVVECQEQESSEPDGFTKENHQ